MNAQQPKSEAQARGRGVLARLAMIAASLLAVFAMIDVALWFLLPASGIVRQTVDIQTPAVLSLKLEDLQRFQGIKVVILGDSLIYGGTMREHGDADWREHTLSRQLERRLAERYPGRPVMVANLGMNGILPVDLDHLVRIVMSVKPDLIVFDLSLRSFSRDFAAENDTQTRKWLARMDGGAGGGNMAAEDQAALGQMLRDFAARHWLLYRFRDFLQSVVFEGEPVNFMLNTRNSLDAWLKAAHFAVPGPDDADLGNIVLIMRARSRYQSIDFEPDNPQRHALDRIFRRLTDADQPTVVFYANENPAMASQLLPDERMRDLRRGLSEAIAPNLSEKLLYLGPLHSLSADDFVDHVHLNREGYGRLAQEIARRAEGLLDPTTTN
jgi:lysophospholipase L1-like esterase